MSVVVGVELGTTGVRAIAMDESGQVIAEADASYALNTPRPGWTEQDPEERRRATREVLGRVVASADAEVVGLGLTGQMPGARSSGPPSSGTTSALKRRRARSTNWWGATAALSGFSTAERDAVMYRTACSVYSIDRAD